jgi:hypothetical protein
MWGCTLQPFASTGTVTRHKAGLNPEPFLLRKAKNSFYNTSPMDMKKLMGHRRMALRA